jgi:hypothetical protein
MTTRLFDHAEHRDPDRRRHWIALVDGNNHQLDRIHAEALRPRRARRHHHRPPAHRIRTAHVRGRDLAQSR